MKYKKIIAVIAALLLALPLSAQKGLAIAAIFDGRADFIDEPTEVYIKGSRLKSYNLTLFRSISIPGNATQSLEVERLVEKDAAKAVEKEQSHISGRLYYGFYRLPDTAKGLHRYIFYRNNAWENDSKDHTLTLIYMEGKATIAQLRQKFGKK